MKKIRGAAQLTIIAFVTALLTTSCRKNPSEIIEKPNVLFISIDDLNDWIGVLGGHPQALTPNLDKFARESVNFQKSFCTAPGCNPSRTSIMTGLAPHTSGVYSNYQDWREVIPDRKSIGTYFRENGYYSTGAGKIFHYHMVDKDCWDDYWPSQDNNMPKEYLINPPEKGPPPGVAEAVSTKTVNMPEFETMYKMFDWAPLDVDDSMMGDYKSVEYVSSVLQRKNEKPFFLACGIYRPHVPWYVPQKYFDLFPLDSIQLPKVLENDLDDVSDRVKDIAHRAGDYHKHVIEAGQWKQAVQGYLASIAFADAMFGKLIASLKSSEYAKNTVVIVWSDHGWQLGEKEHWRKFALWENVLRTVLMIQVPEGAAGLPEGSKNGATCERVVSTQDIYPTLVDLCGLPERKEIDGRSLVPLLRNPKLKWDYPAISSYDFSEFSIRNERFRYTTYVDGSEELYDHNADPEEWKNLANDPGYATTLEELRRHIPQDPAPLMKTSVEIRSFHIPPFKSREEYQDYVGHGKDMLYYINKYWK